MSAEERTGPEHSSDHHIEEEHDPHHQDRRSDGTYRQVADLINNDVRMTSARQGTWLAEIAELSANDPEGYEGSVPDSIVEMSTDDEDNAYDYRSISDDFNTMRPLMNLVLPYVPGIGSDQMRGLAYSGCPYSLVSMDAAIRLGFDRNNIRRIELRPELGGIVDIVGTVRRPLRVADSRVWINHTMRVLDQDVQLNCDVLLGYKFLQRGGFLP